MSIEQKLASDQAESLSFEESLDQYSSQFDGSDGGQPEDDDQGFDEDEGVEDQESTSDEGEDEAVDEAGQNAEAENVNEETQAFELNKNLSLKVGDKVTDQHIKELERGYLREADYTRKTQELAQVRDEANQVIQARDQIVQDPKALRQFIKDEHIMQAFTPHELLSHGLAMNRVPPQLWNKFLQSYQDLEGDGSVNPNWKHDPNAAVIGNLNNQVRSLQQKLTTFEKHQAEQATQAETQKAMQELDGEIKGVLETGKYPGVSREDVLKVLQYDNTNRSIEQITKSIHQELQRKHDAYIQGLRQKQKRKVHKPSGSSVPIMPRQPRNFDEADEILDNLAANGKL